MIGLNSFTTGKHLVCIGPDSFQAVMRPQEYVALLHERLFMKFRNVNMASFHHIRRRCACGLDFNHRREVLKTRMHYLSQKSMSLGRLRSLGLGVLAGGARCL